MKYQNTILFRCIFVNALIYLTSQLRCENKYIFCGIQSDGKKVVAVALDGTLYAWNVESFDENKLPDSSYHGHQFPVTSVAVAKNAKEIISGDTNNLVLIWPESGIARELYAGGNDKKGISLGDNNQKNSNGDNCCSFSF